MNQKFTLTGFAILTLLGITSVGITSAQSAANDEPLTKQSESPASSKAAETQTDLTGSISSISSNLQLKQQINQIKSSPWYSKTRKLANPLELISQIQQAAQLSTIQKEFLLFEISKRLRQISTDEAQAALKQLSAFRPQIRSSLSDGNHQQVITTFPINYSAQASLRYIQLTNTSDRLLTQIKQADFAAIELQSDWLSIDEDQILVIKRVAEQLDISQAQLFLEWMTQQSLFASEARLVVALKANAKSELIDILVADRSIPLQHYIESVLSLWSPTEQLAVIESISTNPQFASQMIYQVAQLDLDESQKNQFWLKKLSDKHSGASAADALAQTMTDDLADQLSQMALHSELALTRNRALLALKLTKSAYAKQKIEALLQTQALPQVQAEELSR